MIKQYLVLRFPKGDNVYTLTENNTLYSSYDHALMVYNKMLMDEGLFPVQKPVKEEVLRAELPGEVIELWFINRAA